jgi:hypothetical protein
VLGAEGRGGFENVVGVWGSAWEELMVEF